MMHRPSIRGFWLAALVAGAGCAHSVPLEQTPLSQDAVDRFLAGGRDADEVLQFLAHTLTNRLLHPPTAALREAALSGDAELARAAERLFPAKAPYAHPATSPTAEPRLPDDPEPAP